MKEIAISKFKATCLGVLERVRKTRSPILITRHGQPIAAIVPPSTASQRTSWLGCMEGTAEFADDLVSPATPAEDWHVLRS